MTAHVWKRGSEAPRVTFRCPWCEVVGASAVYGHYEQGPAPPGRAATPEALRSTIDQRGDVWLLVACASWTCARGVLIRMPHAAPWHALDTGDDGVLLAGPCVMPRSAEER